MRKQTGRPSTKKAHASRADLISGGRIEAWEADISEAKRRR